MTRHDRLLLEALLGRLGEGISPSTVARLLELGLLDRTACERLAIHAEAERLARLDIPCGEALRRTAARFGCSYAKVRQIIYSNHPSHT